MYMYNLTQNFIVVRRDNCIRYNILMNQIKIYWQLTFSTCSLLIFYLPILGCVFNQIIHIPLRINLVHLLVSLFLYSFDLSSKRCTGASFNDRQEASIISLHLTFRYKYMMSSHYTYSNIWWSYWTYLSNRGWNKLFDNDVWFKTEMSFSFPMWPLCFCVVPFQQRLNIAYISPKSTRIQEPFFLLWCFSKRILLTGK